MLTKNDLINQREAIQDDLLCILDGLEDDILTNVCQVVVDRLNMLVDKLDEQE